MKQRRNLKILAFVGLAGSGKSTAVEHFTTLGYPKVYFGGVILNAMDEAGLDHTAENEKIFREEYRQKHGDDVVVKEIIEQINGLADAGQRRVVANGLYTWTEYKALKAAFPGELVVIAIVTPRHVRYRRLAQRPVRPLTSTEAYERDRTEIENLEKGGPIAIADHYVSNAGSVEDFHQALVSLAQEIEL